MQQSPSQYPRPGKVGGKLIRELVASLRTAIAQTDAKLELPLGSHILLTLSGGSDSIALALLIKKYGRRAMDAARLSAIHINHGWRGKESNEDERFVREFCKAQGIPLKVVRLKDQPKEGESWEDAGRRARKAAYEAWSARTGGWILTGHHADDLAETVLWRLLTGGAESHGGGIAWAHGRELRPLLKIRKKDLQAFLREEGQVWREDATNHEGRFLRSRLRQEIFPNLERLFPRAVDRLIEFALRAQEAQLGSGGSSLPFSGLGAAGIRLRLPHWKDFQKLARGKEPGRWEIHLPDGWLLRLKRTHEKLGKKATVREQWVFERDKPLE